MAVGKLYVLAILAKWFWHGPARLQELHTQKTVKPASETQSYASVKQTNALSCDVKQLSMVEWSNTQFVRKTFPPFCLPAHLYWNLKLSFLYLPSFLEVF